MLDRLRQSLALRLAALYALVFALGAGALFGVLYWMLANALEAREMATLETRAQGLATAYAQGGIFGMRNVVDSDKSAEMRALFVRLMEANGTTSLVKYPDTWIETQVRQLLAPNPFGLSATQEIHTVRIPQDALRDYAVTLQQLPGGGTLQVARSTDSRAVLLAPLRRGFVSVGAAALLLSAGLGTILAWRATRPIRQVSDTARRILETGDLSARVPTEHRSGELALLVSQLNTLLDKNAAHVRVLRETLDHLAHDMRTPLTRLRGTAELAIQDGGDPAEARAALADCVEESDRVLHLLETLLDVSAAEAGALKLNRDRIDLRMLADRAADLYREVAEEKKITITLDQPAPAELDADAIRLGQAVNNLVDNALKYTPDGGQVVIATRAEPAAAVLTVTDTGPGVPLAEREAIWRRLYRGDSSRSQRGLGLGLSLVKAIVEAHGGTATVEEAPGGGARFTLRVPVVP